MENNIRCRTCLAITLNPKNVRDIKYKNLLEILKYLLGFEIEDEMFEICEICENTLNLFLKFKDMCLKSMQTNLQCIEIKQESLDIKNHSVEENSVSLSNESKHSNFLQEASSRPKDTQNSNKNFKQFPKTDVLQAISELKTYSNSDKFTTCIHCVLISKSVKGLSHHMTKNHKKLAKFWCDECNIQTDDLQKHKELTTCSEFFCKFCNNYCPLNEAVGHLQNHCHRSDEEILSVESNNISVDPLKFRVAQFSKDDVLQTIFEFRKSRNVLKLRTCLHCGHVCKSARGLSIHMTAKHKDLEKLWCFYCNVQTEDLEKHKELRKCSYFFCTFCNYFAASMKQPTIHLQSHCRDISNLDGIAQEMLSEENNAEIDGGFIIEDPSFTHKSMLKNDLDQNTFTNDLQSSSSVPHVASYRLKQYPKNIVLKAIFEFRKSRNIYKLRSCLHCRHICKSARGLSIHMSHKHKDLLKSWCFQCNVQTDDIDKHKEVAKCSDFFCKFCNKYSVQMKEPTTHLKSHCRDIHSSDESDQEILYGKRRKTENIAIDGKSLENHLEDNTSINYCHNTKASLKMKKRSFSKLCPICGKLIGRSSNLSKHLQIHNATQKLDIKKHHIDRKKPYVCSVCGKAFASSSDWKKHERIHEGGPQVCPICNVECCRPERLKLHMRRHTGENKFICAQCGISFHIKSILLKHIISHSDEKQFKCSFCDRYFKYTDQVTVHERTHTGIRPYACTLCSYTSSRAKNLTTHMKKHPEDEPQANAPYKCQMCTMRFSTNAMRVSHTNNRHIMNNKNNNQIGNRA